MKHFVVYREEGGEPVDCYATQYAAQAALRQLGSLAQINGQIGKVRDEAECPACGMIVDDGLEAEIL